MSGRAMLHEALVAALKGDAALSAALTQVFDAPPVRGARPYALVEEAVLTDWSTKDMAGREGRVAVSLFDTGERPVRARQLAEAVEDALAAMPREVGEGWRIVTLGLVRSGADAALAAPVEARVELSELAVDGPGAVLDIGDVIVPEHGLSICSGYDDSYHVTPARLLRNALQLGYRGDIVHYVGMSHYFRLEPVGDGYRVSLAGRALNGPCGVWHDDFARRANGLGFGVIWSLSYELFDAHCWDDWKQRAGDGSPALTGWEPPSALLSPAHSGAMAYLQAVAKAFVGLAQGAGLAVKFQVGEPWWWVMADGRLCIHDAAASAALGDPPEQNVRDAPDVAVLDAAGALLAASTAALAAAVREVSAEATTLLLAYTQRQPRDIPGGGSGERAVDRGAGRMSWLDEPLATIALCWRIERRDGVTIGLTAHDRDLEIDGLCYRAAPGMTPSAIKRSASFDADSMDVTGALSGAAISERDLLAGRWDGARVALFAVDWTNPLDAVPLGSGTIGAVETRDGVLTAELRGAAAALEAPVSEVTTPECRAELGDARCRVAMAGRRQIARVLAADDVTLTLDAGAASGAYAGGRLRWLSGGNSGLEDAVAASDGAIVTLRRAPRFAAAGALVEISEGCDKSIATCAGRFGNAANFRGEPYLPGIDLLTRYPGA